MNKKAVHFWRSFLLFSVFLLAADQLIGRYLKSLYMKQTGGFNGRTMLVMNHISDSILIFGSSKGVYNYDPAIFEKSLGQSVYNSSRNAESILYHYALVQTLSKRYRPSLILVDCRTEELDFVRGDYDQLAHLLPFYKRNQSIAEVVLHRSHFENIKLLSQIYPFNGELLTIINNIHAMKVNADYKGFEYLNNKWEKEKEVVSLKPEVIDTFKLRMLDSLVAVCHQKSIKLAFVISPVYLEFKEPTFTELYLDSLAKKNNIFFADYVRDTFFLARRNLFNDPYHLNKNGAEIYSENLANKLGTLSSAKTEKN